MSAMSPGVVALLVIVAAVVVPALLWMAVHAAVVAVGRRRACRELAAVLATTPRPAGPLPADVELTAIWDAVRDDSSP